MAGESFLAARGAWAHRNGATNTGRWARGASDSGRPAVSMPLTGHAAPDRAQWPSADAGIDDAVGAGTVAPSRNVAGWPRAAVVGAAGRAGAAVADVPSSGRLVAAGSEAGWPASDAGAGFP